MWINPGSNVGFLITMITFVWSASSHGATVENVNRENNLFQIEMQLPTTPVKGGNCPTLTVRISNKLGRKVALTRADLSVYWFMRGRVQSVNGGKSGETGSLRSLLNSAGRLKSTGQLDVQTVNVCAGSAGFGRIAASIKYTTTAGRTGAIGLGHLVCVRNSGNDTSCDVVDPRDHPTGIYPLRILRGEKCESPAYAISLDTQVQACVDPDVFPPATLFSVSADSQCVSGTIPVAGSSGSSRRLCVVSNHPASLEWVRDSSVPSSARAQADGAEGYIPVNGRTDAASYLAIRSHTPVPTMRFERVNNAGTPLYAITVAGSPAKLPVVPGGYWRPTSSRSFLANAYGSDSAGTALYCGVSATSARCSTSRGSLSDYSEIIESLFAYDNSARDLTPVVVYGDSDIATALLTQTNGVSGAIQSQAKRTVGHTAIRPGKRRRSQPFKVTTIASGLVKPWSAAILPNGNLLVTEKPGRLRLIRNGVLDPRSVSGLPVIAAEKQGGLLDVVLDPDFAQNRMIYLSFSAGNTATGYGTEVVSARLTGYRLTQVKKIFVAQPKTDGFSHFGSRLAFDANGFLYITLGERGRRWWAQDLSKHPGSVIRINRDGSVPDDNPFVNTPGALPEIYSYGHRNPQGLAIDAATGRVWVNEHGPKGGDEVNLIRAGKNYGWPVVSYGEEYTGGAIGQSYTRPGLADPAWYWVPSIAPSGMAFYSDDAIQEFSDSLLVGGLKAKLFASLETSGDRVGTEERWLEHRVGRVRDIKVDRFGSIYLLTDAVNGRLLRLEPR